MNSRAEMQRRIQHLYERNLELSNKVAGLEEQNERLRETAASAEGLAEMYKTENERLRKENAKLSESSAWETYGRLLQEQTEENERLRAVSETRGKAMVALGAEVDRLRAEKDSLMRSLNYCQSEIARQWERGWDAARDVEEK